METITRILAAIDLSLYSPGTLFQAASLARSLGARLILGNVINKRDLDTIQAIYKPMTEHHASPYSVVYVSVEKYLEETKQDRQERIKALIEEVGAGDVAGEMHFFEGVPFEELIRMVHDLSVDLVVIGPKGRSNLPHTLFGTTAEKMFRHCPVSLLSVRTEEFRTIRKRRGELQHGAQA